jgi:hypothetical protein
VGPDKRHLYVFNTISTSSTEGGVPSVGSSERWTPASQARALDFNRAYVEQFDRALDWAPMGTAAAIEAGSARKELILHRKETALASDTQA